MWLPEILFVYLWGKVAGLSSAKNKSYGYVSYEGVS